MCFFYCVVAAFANFSNEYAEIKGETAREKEPIKNNLSENKCSAELLSSRLEIWAWMNKGDEKGAM